MNPHIEQLKTYIHEQINAGFKPDEIVSHLQAANWPEADIHEAFRMLHADMTPTTMAPVAGNPPHAAESSKGRIRTGWRLFMQSLRILKGNPGLTRYVVMTWLMSMLLYIALILVLFLGFRAAYALGAPHPTQGFNNVFVYVFLFVVYILLFFVSDLYNAGLAANVLDIFHGQRKPYSEYMRLARSKAGALFAYAAIQATVGTLLQIIAERVRFVGWILARLLGALWSLGTLFVVPIIVTTDKPSGPGSVKQSMRLFKQTWGESIVSRASAGVALFFIYLLGTLVMAFIFFLAVFGAGSAFGNTGAAIVGIILGIIWVFAFIVFVVLAAAANNIINIALFYYATSNQVPPAFDADLLNSVFVARKRGLFGKKKS